MRNFIVLPALAASASATVHPHLSQAWQAMSTGDGEQGATGLESYLFENCNPPTASCINGHVFNYGADTCIKYEVNMGFKSAYTGVYYVNCDAVNCCVGNDESDPKMWDIGQGERVRGDKIVYLGKRDTTELNGNPVKGADAWLEEIPLPFTKLVVNYTYYITTDGNDVITHRIDYGAGSSASTGSILYGDFKVQRNLTTFRDVFKAPAECLKPNTLTCPSDKVEEWERKYFNRLP